MNRDPDFLGECFAPGACPSIPVLEFEAQIPDRYQTQAMGAFSGSGLWKSPVAAMCRESSTAAALRRFTRTTR